MNTFKDNIIQKIKTGEVDMKPRWHFVLKTSMFFVGLIIVSVLAVYFLSFLMFVLHRTGVWFTPTFGLRGVIFFVVSSPWIIITLVAIFLALLYLLITHYAFSYKKPLVYSMIGVVLFVIALSSLIQQAAVHERVNLFIERHEVPGFTTLYRGNTGIRPDGLTIGRVVELNTDGFFFEDEFGENVMVIIDERTKQPPMIEYQIGDELLIFGETEGEILRAYGIRVAADDFLPPPEMRVKKNRIEDDI